MYLLTIYRKEQNKSSNPGRVSAFKILVSSQKLKVNTNDIVPWSWISVYLIDVFGGESRYGSIGLSALDLFLG